MSWGKTNWSGGSAKTHHSEGSTAHVGKDVEEAAGSLQVCAGQDGGYEAAVHAMWSIFQDADNEGCLLVDASNAFLNRRAALHNVSILSPPLSHQS